MEKARETGLTGKVAMVTGASYGIGKAIVERLAEDGATVVLGDIIDRVDETTSELASQGLSVSSARIDIRDADNVARAVAEVTSRHGKLDIMICNAAAPRSSLSILDMTRLEWDNHMEINARGTLYCIQSAARAMIAGKAGGRIVTMASSAALRPYKRRAHYSASKAAIIALTRSAALELAEHRITVNCVAPSGTRTENWEMMASGTLNEAEGRMMRERSAAIPLGMCEPADIASAVGYMVSPGAARFTGQTMLVDGGGLLV